jgi:hypothetical protein
MGGHPPLMSLRGAQATKQSRWGEGLPRTFQVLAMTMGGEVIPVVPNPRHQILDKFKNQKAKISGKGTCVI